VVTARTDWALSGRAWPIIGGATVAVGLLVIAVSPGLPGFRHLQFGSRVVDPVAWTGLPAVIHGGVGTTTIYLASLPTPLPAPRTLAIDNAAGQMEITVPNVPVRVVANLAAGQLVVNGVVNAGWHRGYTVTLNPTAPGPTLTLLVQSGFGKVDIEPAASPASADPAQTDQPTSSNFPLPPTVPSLDPPTTVQSAPAPAGQG
jgi:hypothetical protein